MKDVDPRSVRLCHKHGGHTVAQLGASFFCPLCKQYWVYGEKTQKPLKYDTRGIV